MATWIDPDNATSLGRMSGYLDDDSLQRVQRRVTQFIALARIVHRLDFEAADEDLLARARKGYGDIVASYKAIRDFDPKTFAERGTTLGQYTQRLADDFCRTADHCFALITPLVSYLAAIPQPATSAALEEGETNP